MFNTPEKLKKQSGLPDNETQSLNSLRAEGRNGEVLVYDQISLISALNTVINKEYQQKTIIPAKLDNLKERTDRKIQFKV